MTIGHYAAWTKQSTSGNVRSFLGEQAAFLSTKDIYGRTVLHLAAQRGNIALVETILSLIDWSQGQAKNNVERTSLHYAKESIRVCVIDMLINHEILIDALDIYGRTALHHSATEDTLAAMKHLITIADEQQLAEKDNEGKSILHLAIEYKNSAVDWRAGESAFDMHHPISVGRGRRWRWIWTRV